MRQHWTKWLFLNQLITTNDRAIFPMKPGRRKNYAVDIFSSNQPYNADELKLILSTKISLMGKNTRKVAII